MLRVNFRNFGGVYTSQDIRRLRGQVMDLCRMMGQPVVWRHRFTPRDLTTPYVLDLGGASKLTIATQRCPACYNTAYKNSRTDCLVCFGTTITSVEEDPAYYISTAGRLTEEETDEPAPLYRGFGPPVLTWVMEPDAPEEAFKPQESGILDNLEVTELHVPWYPPMQDSEVIANVTLKRGSDHLIEEVGDRYQLESVTPITIRGFGRMTGDRRFIVGQRSRISKYPHNHFMQNLDMG
jgi:hypothetical protein